MKRRRIRVGGFVVAAVTPLLVLAGHLSRKEFQDALRAKPDLDSGAQYFPRA
jgi:hypothetical protein